MIVWMWSVFNIRQLENAILRFIWISVDDVPMKLPKAPKMLKTLKKLGKHPKHTIHNATFSERTYI